MAKKIGKKTITVIRSPKVDPLDDDVVGSPPEHDEPGCVVMPRTSFEQERGWVIVQGRMVVAPFGADILPDDKVRVDGVIWEVDGEAGDYENKHGEGKATIVYLKRLGT